MSGQKKVDLNEPLDVEAKPTLNKTNLTPELSEGAITLHGDFYRQQQSQCNRYIFWHPFSLFVLITASSIYFVYLAYDLIAISDDVFEFIRLLMRNKLIIVSVFPCLTLLFACIGLSAFLVSDEFRVISDKLMNPSYVDQLFGFDLAKYSKLTNEDNTRQFTPKELKFLNDSSKNSHLIIYRDSPIAVITVKPLLDNSTESNFFVKITGINVRKVFAKVDFETLLIEWALLRSREIMQEYLKSKKITKNEGCKLNILIESYSFNKGLNKILKSLSFGLVKEDLELNPFAQTNEKLISFITTRSVTKFFGVKRQTYGLTLLTKNEDEDILLQTGKEFNSGSSKASTKVTKRRK